MAEPVSIEGLDKVDLLCQLFAEAKAPTGNSKKLPPFTRSVAEIFVKRGDLTEVKISGRLIGVDLRNGSFDPIRYDLANGEGAARKCVEALRRQMAEATAVSAEAGK